MTGRETALKRAKMMRVVLLDHGVPEVAIGGLLPGRPGPADVWNGLDPVALLSHHIASRPTPANPTPGLWVVRNGRPDLSGPLANGTAGVDLVYRFVTLGWANHPGLGGPYTFRGPLGAFTVPRDNGRPYLWGTEYEGGFTDEVWDREYTNKRTKKTMTFREFMGRCNAGLAEAIWLPGISSRDKYRLITPAMDLSGYHGEHKTWAPGRKPDRHNYTTESGRAEIRRYNEREEDDMPTPEDLWNFPVPKQGGEKGDTQAAKWALAQARQRATDANVNSRKALAGIRELSRNLGPTVEEAVIRAMEAVEDDSGEE